jgi:hypothetical protein
MAFGGWMGPRTTVVETIFICLRRKKKLLQNQYARKVVYFKAF